MSFSSILQAAAAQAWSRLAHPNRARTVANKADTKEANLTLVTPLHLPLSCAATENNLPNHPSTKAEATLTCNHAHTPASNLQISCEILDRDRSSRQTEKRTGFTASQSATSKPVRPYTQSLVAGFEDRRSVFRLREVNPKRTSRMSGSLKLPRARPIKLEDLSTHDFDWRDPGRVLDLNSYWPDPPLTSGAQVCIHNETLPHMTTKPPTSPKDLYRHLLQLTSNGPFTIRRIIDYYFQCPDSMHSTKSFNFLIGLALRNASFQSAARLLNAMQIEGIQHNLETWKLRVRWLVRTDRWNEAWRLVLGATEQKNALAMRPNDPVPLELWLELLGSQKRGALRHWIIRKRASSVQDTMKSAMQSNQGHPPEHDASEWDNDLHSDLGNSPKTDSIASSEGHHRDMARDNSVEDIEPLPLQTYRGFEKQLVPKPWQRTPAIEESQYRALMQVSPLRQAFEDIDLSPRAILIIARAMFLVGQRTLALSTTLSYFASLPPRLRRCDRRSALDLVHFHLAMITHRGKPGLKQHFTQRRILQKFLDARPNLIPTSMTLFLLLRPLRGCRRSGTLAMQCLRLFEKRWGPRRMQSKLVRHRIATLALKEGRLDIVRSVIKLELKENGTTIHDEFPRVTYPTRRIPWRHMFARRGVWNRRWHRIETKYSRKLR